MSLLEAGMMASFGLSWPIAAYKTYKCKCVHGKSLTFSYLILFGYICGILNKLLYNNDYVIWIYYANAVFLLLYMFLYSCFSVSYCVVYATLNLLLNKKQHNN